MTLKKLLITELRKEIKLLKMQNAALRRDCSALRARVNSANPLTGGAVENKIAKLIGGKLTHNNACYDVRGPKGTRIEVKFSRLNKPHERAIAHRWSWGYPRGVGGAKRYDRLILVGEADPQYRRKYCEPRSPYVLFDVPFKSVVRLMRKNVYIQGSSNPNAQFNQTGRELFSRFHVSRNKLKERYGLGPDE